MQGQTQNYKEMKITKKIAAVLASLFLVPSVSAVAAGFDTGYRGFVDLGYTVGVGDYSDGRFEMTTTHGYQALPWLFVGGGFGVNAWGDGFVSVPIFADARFDICKGVFTNSRLNPFVDVKIGGSAGDAQGFYFHPSVGLRFAALDKLGVSFAIGYTLNNVEVVDFDIIGGGSIHENFGGISFKVGVDF